jgi:hypothetical protein
MPRSNIITTDLEKVLKNAIRAELTSGDKDVSKLLETIISKELGLLHPIVNTKWAVKRYGVVIDQPERPGNPCVIKDGDLYRLYTGVMEVWTSPDGKSWTKVATNIMTPTMVNNAGYNVTGVYQPCVVKYNGIYYLFFAGDQLQPWGVRRDQIFLATSIDGITFGNIRAVITPVQNSMEERCWHPYVVRFKDKWWCYYITTDYRLTSSNPMQNRLACAISDNLITWEKIGEVIIEPAMNEWDSGRMYDHSVVNIEDRFLLLVSAVEATAGGGDMRIGAYYSFNGKTFYRHRMLLTRVLSAEKKYIADNTTLYEGGKLKIWYEAYDGIAAPVRLIYAEAIPGNSQIMELWVNESISTSGATTDDVDTKFDKKTFYIISNQSGTLYVQAYDEVANDFKDIDSKSVSANTLTPYSTTYGARRMKLKFIPSASAVVSAWMVAE